MFWLGIVVSLCYVPGVTGAYIATQWPVLAVLMTFGLLRKGPFTVFHAFGLAFVAYAAMRLPFSPVPYASVFGLWQTVIMGLCLWFGTTLTSTRELYAGLAAGAAVSSAVVVLQYLGWEPALMLATSTPDGITNTTPAGLYVNPVQLGAVLVLIAVALASERMWLWIVPLLPGIALAHSRGAWVALAVGLLGCYTRRLWIFGVVAVVGAFYLLSPLSSSDEARMYIWHVAWANLTWLGAGPGVFYTIVLLQDGIYKLYPEYAHNDALQLAFEYGLGAALPFVVFGYALWRTDAKEWPVVTAFVTLGCYSMPLFMPIVSFLGFVAVGRILRGYGVAVSDGGCGRQSFVPGAWGSVEAGGQFVSVASHHSTES